MGHDFMNDINLSTPLELAEHIKLYFNKIVSIVTY